MKLLSPRRLIGIALLLTLSAGFGRAQAPDPAVPVVEASALAEEIANLAEAVGEIANDPEVATDAQETAEAALLSLAGGDIDDARRKADDLRQLLAYLRIGFEVAIVSRPGELIGVYRILPDDPAIRYYYLIVEAIGENGQPVPRVVRSNETGIVSTVTRWGVGVRQWLYFEMIDDKADDGVIVDPIIGWKPVGDAVISWRSGVSGGAITEW